MNNNIKYIIVFLMMVQCIVWVMMDNIEKKKIPNQEKNDKLFKGLVISAIFAGVFFLLCMSVVIGKMNYINPHQPTFEVFAIYAAGYGLSAFCTRWIYRKRARLKAGIKGETKTANVLSSLPTNYQVLANVNIEFEGKRAEIDNLIISHRGLVIIETKSYNGVLEGLEDDREWTYTKISRGGRKYKSVIRNPIKQSKRQAYILSNMLKQNNIKCWIDSYVYLQEGKCSVNSDKLFQQESKLIQKIVASGRENALNEESVKRILGVLGK